MVNRSEPPYTQTLVNWSRPLSPKFLIGQLVDGSPFTPFHDQVSGVNWSRPSFLQGLLFTRQVGNTHDPSSPRIFFPAARLARFRHRPRGFFSPFVHVPAEPPRWSTGRSPSAPQSRSTGRDPSATPSCISLEVPPQGALLPTSPCPRVLAQPPKPSPIEAFLDLGMGVFKQEQAPVGLTLSDS